MFQEITKLFATSLRIKVIKCFALQSEGWFAGQGVASAVGSTKARVQSELRSLETIGIIESKKEKGTKVYRWNATYVGALYVQDFVISVTTPNDQTLASYFRPLTAHLVVAAGTLANETRGVVDVLIVTKRIHDPRIAKVIKKVELITAVPVRYLVLEVSEYLARREGFDRVLRDIFDFKHRVILGRA
jgi:predicted transcriptional regulator